MALTTLQFWQQQLTIYQAEQAAAQSDLTAAQALQKAANTQLAADLKSLDQITSSIAAMRAQLAVTTIPADANALVAQITAQIIQQRGLQGAVLDDQDAIVAALRAGLDEQRNHVDLIRAVALSRQCLHALLDPGVQERLELTAQTCVIENQPSQGCAVQA